MLGKHLLHSQPLHQRWQQQQQHHHSSLAYYCCHHRPPASQHVHASTQAPKQRGALMPAASALEKLNIQPLVLPEEARQLMPAEDQPQQQQSAAPGMPAAVHLDQIPPVEAWGQDTFLVSGCEPESAPLRVAVLVSGGVDSSLALKLVTAAGHAATAFYLQIWFQEDFRNFWDACPWEEDLQYAQQVCDALGVPLVVVPLTQQYWDRVVSHSVAEIKEGRTPNPDMLCNSRVKFGAFFEYLQTEHAGSFDRIASGHYARVTRLLPQDSTVSADSSSSHSSDSSSSHDESTLLERQASNSQASSSSSVSPAASLPPAAASAAQLMLVPDAVKDQTYFLANLSPAQLARCMFPLGSFTKPQVRALATAAGLATSGRKDSQGICFLGKVKFGEFVGQHLGEWPGPLVEEDTGQVVGVHGGYWFYTVGQRGGIKLPGGPWYVTRKDMATNIVYVSRTYYEAQRRRDAFAAGPFNWLGASRPRLDQPLFVKLRHGPNVYECSLQLGSREEVAAALEHGSAAAFEPSRAGHVQAAANSSSEGAGDDTTSSGSSQAGSSGTQGSAPSLSSGSQTDSSNGVQHSPPSQDTGVGQAYGIVLLSGNDQGLAPGQYAVFYQGQQCLGSAQIMGSLASSPSAGVYASSR